jgi:hypothetical protein
VLCEECIPQRFATEVGDLDATTTEQTGGGRGWIVWGAVLLDGRLSQLSRGGDRQALQRAEGQHDVNVRFCCLLALLALLTLLALLA